MSQFEKTHPASTIILVLIATARNAHRRFGAHRMHCRRFLIATANAAGRSAAVLAVGRLAATPSRHTVLDQRNDQRHDQTDQQYEKYARHIAQRQLIVGVRFVRRTFAAIVPPFVLQPRHVAVFDQRQHRQIDGHPQRRAQRCGNAEALHVEMLADLHRVARLPRVGVVVLRRLDEQRVFAARLAHPLDAVRVVGHEHVRLGGHELPHAAERGQRGALLAGRWIISFNNMQ